MGDYVNKYLDYREDSLQGRYITNAKIEPYLSKYNSSICGYSVLHTPIYQIGVGNGPIKILMWSQMHGNESTTTKSIFDLLSYLKTKSSVFKDLTILIVPILNPDGAQQYTRHNAHNVDLNRDALDLSQPESKVLRNLFNRFKPDYCFNLHDQRTIFGVDNQTATVSFLAPSADHSKSFPVQRKKAIQLIESMNNMLQRYIPGRVGRYDDSFNLQCVGDYFQKEAIPTILFESGHHPNDYQREITRKWICFSLIHALEVLSSHSYSEPVMKYQDIPENKKIFYDIILRNVEYKFSEGPPKKGDVAIHFHETLINNQIEFVPKFKNEGDLSRYFGHSESDLNHNNPIFLYDFNINAENCLKQIILT